MTTKAQKAIKTGHKPLMTFELPEFTMRKRKPAVRLQANLFADLDPDSMSFEEMKSIFQMLKSQVKAELALRREHVFCVLDVLALLETPSIERDNKGKRLKNQDGSFKSMERLIKERRIFNRIHDAIEDSWDAIEDGRKGDDDTPIEDYPVTITIKADDAVLLCEKMIEFYKETPSPSFHVVEAYDLFIGVKKEAEEKWDAYETGKEEEAEKEPGSKKK